MAVSKDGYLKAILLVCALWAVCSTAVADVIRLQGRENYLPGEILVRFKDDASVEKRSKALLSMGRAQALSRPGLFRVHLPPGQDVRAAADKMQQDPSVLYAQPNYRYYALACSPPSDQYYNTPENWPLLKIQAPQAWSLFSSCPPGSASVTVAVLDSGVSRDNPDLKGVPLIGYNSICDVQDESDSCTCSGPVSDSAVGPVTASMDDFGHGTYVAGIINASWNLNWTENSAVSVYSVCDKFGGPSPYVGVSDGGGYAGVAPGITLLAVKILDCTGSGSTASIVAGTDFAVSMGARVLNYSLGSGSAGGIDPAEKEALDNALAHDCVIVAASGNDSQLSSGIKASVDFPAAYPPVIAVGATDENDKVADYSNGGSYLDLVAPGGSANAFTGNALNDSSNKIFGPFLAPLPFGAVTECGFEPLSSGGSVTDPYFGVAAGTSASTPFVSAAAALILSMYPTLSYSQVAERLVDNADSLNGNQGWDPRTGYGRLNIYRALTNSSPGLTSYLTTFNSPNPFYPDVNSSTNITLAIAQPGPVELTLYDTGGETVFHKTFAPGDLNDNPSNPQFKSYYIPWDGRNGAGQLVKTGVYFYSVKVNGQVGRNKIAVIRGSK